MTGMQETIIEITDMIETLPPESRASFVAEIGKIVARTLEKFPQKREEAEEFIERLNGPLHTCPNAECDLKCTKCEESAARLYNQIVTADRNVANERPPCPSPEECDPNCDICPTHAHFTGFPHFD